MRIDFEDGSYVELSKSKNYYSLIVAAQNMDNTKTINFVELTNDEFSRLVADFVTKPTVTKKKTTRKKTSKKTTNKKQKEEK